MADSTIPLKVTTGVLVSIEDYNALEDARKVSKVVRTGVSITVILNGQECGMSPPNTATIYAVCMAARYLLPSLTGMWRMECRTPNGVLLDVSKTLEVLDIKNGDRLFVSLYREPGDDQ